MGKEKAPKLKKGKKNDLKEFEGDDMTIYFDLFKQLKGQFYKEKGGKSTLEALKESLGGAVLKDVTFFYQKLNKKSTETITKTLKEFMSFLETKEPEFFLSLITSYTIIHEKLLTTEFSRDIFINLLKIDQLIITKNKQAIKKNFRSFYPSWFLMQHEIIEDVKKLSQENLELLFPDKEKHSAAFYVSYQHYLSLIQSWLAQPSKQFKDVNMFLDDDDCDRVHSRLLGLAVRSLDSSLTLLADNEAAEEYFDKVKNLLKFDENGNLIVELFNRLKKDFSLRAEIAHLYLTLIDLGVEDFSSKQSPNLVKTFISNTDCKEPLLQKVFWEDQLLLRLLPAIEPKPEQFDLGKVYKKIQSILEIGGMGIGIPFFENFNEFLKRSPLLNFAAFPNSKKFTGSLQDTFKQVEGFLKAYMNCLETDICKFYIGKLVDLFFDLSYHILVECTLKTRQLIADQKLYHDKDLTDVLKKNIESFMDKFVDLLVLYPLDIYLEKNSPDHMSELAIGINNYKFIPKGYARFLKRLILESPRELLVANKDLVEKALNKFASSVAGFSKDKKKFESFLILIDGLAKEKIESSSEETSSLTDIIKQLFSASSQFLQDFSNQVFDSEKIEKAFNAESFANFSKYFANILNSDSDLNKEICETLIPGVVRRLVATLTDCLDDQFDLFEDESKRLDIIHQLFSVFYTVQAWKAKQGKLDIKEINEVFSKLLIHVKEVQSVDDSLFLTKLANIATIVVALTPNQKPKTLLTTLRSSKPDIKADSVTWAESNSGFKHTTFDQFAPSSTFKDVCTQVFQTFMKSKQLPAMVFYDISRRFAKYVAEPTLLDILTRVLSKANNKDEFVGYKLASIESRIAHLESPIQFVYLLFGYIHESKTFATDSTICDLEKFMDKLPSKVKNLIIRTAVDLLISPLEVFNKQNQANLTGSPVDYVVLLDFFLNKLVQEEDLEEETAVSAIESVTSPSNYGPEVLSEIYPWLIFKAVLKNLQTQSHLKTTFTKSVTKKDHWITSHCILAAPSCLQIVMNYELRTFLNDICSTYLIPGLISLSETNLDIFLAFIHETIILSTSKDIQFVYSLKRILTQISGDESVDDSLKQKVFVQVCQSLEEASKSSATDRLSDLIEITSNVILYFNRSLLKKDFVQDFKNQVRLALFSALKIPAPTKEADEQAKEVTVDYYFEVKASDFVFNLALYLSLCRGSKSNSIYEFKNICFDIIKESGFSVVKKEVLLTLLIRVLNVAIEDGDLEKFADRIPQIEATYSEGISLSSFGAQKNLLLVTMLEFIRKVLGVLEMFSKEFEQSIHSQIMNLAVSRVHALKNIHFEPNPVLHSQTRIEDYGCGFDELLVEFAETLSRFSLSQKFDIKENELYLLLNSEVPVIQKSVFVVLSDYYENKIVPSKDFEEVEQSEDSKQAVPAAVVPELLRVLQSRASSSEESQSMKPTKKKQAQESSEILEIRENSEGKDLSLFSYVLTWIQFMQRLKSGRLEESAEQKYYENMLTSNPQLYFGFLNHIFKWILGLKIPGKELEKIIEKSPMGEMPLQWIDFISKETMIDLVLHAFYKFSSGFPKFLRNWVGDADKKYSGLAELVVKKKVSKMILDFEINQIENKEPIWRSDEFSIVSYKNTKEIEATYTKEESSLMMRFVFPDTYPIE